MGKRGRKPAAEHGFAPAIFVRLPLVENYQLRTMVRADRPLGVVARELLLKGLEFEMEQRALAKAARMKRKEERDARGAEVDGQAS